MTRVERFIKTMGRTKPTYDQLAKLAKLLVGTDLSSSVTFKTERAGASIRYRLVGRVGWRPISTVLGTKAALPVGLYHIWIERDGVPTSPKDASFLIVQKREIVKIEEQG